ncbi:cytochrome p450 [Moniliophthora roreri MCA 2997]|uniref:Cytochrome p450 n=2 Tax=Moniliophthora roreri TaxID=221103 RepID=V2WNR2_MONRO|nr:cytochrome p450 [Moniliophthora roreri MCA 2997]KAI3601240.1 cytochrome p450 [Moniliophthora roreri]
MDAILIALGALICTFVLLARNLKRNPNLPPGPKMDPVIGHLRIIPPGNQGKTFHQWSQTYGDVMYLKVFGREMVILGSHKAAQDLLENRGANYSCRPKITTFEIMGWYPSVTFLQYGKRFLKHRKMYQQYFGPRESRALDHALAQEARTLVKNLSTATAGQHQNFLYRFTTSNIMRAAFGHQIKSNDDPFLELGKAVSYALNNSGPIGNTPVDLFPLLRYFPSWFPGVHYGTLARSNFPTIRKLHEVTIDFVQRRMREGGLVERSFASDHLEALGDNPDPEALDDIKGGSATIFAGGTDTTYATLTVFFLAMIHYPEVQRRAYEEIMSVIGPDRLPVYSDKESLSYLDCVLTETLRWYPVAPLAVPHRALEADTYKGMLIPKGAVVIANVHGMSRDENVYSEPEKFDPTRYLPKPHGKGEPLYTAGWGFGRRICPGRHFAPITLWHAMACILATMEIKPVEDKNGKAVLPEIAFTEGLISKAVPFDCQVQVRSEAAKALLSQIEM